MFVVILEVLTTHRWRINQPKEMTFGFQILYAQITKFTCKLNGLISSALFNLVNGCIYQPIGVVPPVTCGAKNRDIDCKGHHYRVIWSFSTIIKAVWDVCSNKNHLNRLGGQYTFRKCECGRSNGTTVFLSTRRGLQYYKIIITILSPE